MPRDLYGDFRSTLDEGYDHHGVRFARVREGWEVRRGNEVLSNYVVVGPVVSLGVGWWHVYKRRHDGRLRWLGRRPFEEEAAALVDGDSKGRVSVSFAGINFALKPLGGGSD